MRQIIERDESGNETAQYLSVTDSERIDIIKPPNKTTVWNALAAIFLPAGYPCTVTSDYTSYQIYDSLQAFSSSIAGLLASRAVLEGVGVGNASASPTTALLLSVLQETMGRIATILFAHRLGSSLEPECKMYRLAADLFNDAALVFDCLSPALPKLPRVILLCFSNMLRALCGVTAGSSKASLSAHFAKSGNLGELNAKDSSQETVISLLGMLVGSLVVGYVTSSMATWTCLVLLLSIHLGTNYAAVRSVRMHSLNRQRANLVFSNLLESQRALTPEDVSNQERIFTWGGGLRWQNSISTANAKIGVSLQSLLDTLNSTRTITGAIRDSQLILQRLLEIFDKEQYLVWYDAPQNTVFIVLKGGASARAQIKAWALSLLVAHRFSMEDATSAAPDKTLSLLQRLLIELTNQWGDFIVQLQKAGWNVDAANLQTASNPTRIYLRSTDTSSAKSKP